jgi:hypothetical protein
VTRDQTATDGGSALFVSASFLYQLVLDTPGSLYPVVKHIPVPLAGVTGVACSSGLETDATSYAVWFLVDSTVYGYTLHAWPSDEGLQPLVNISLPEPVDTIFSRRYTDFTNALASLVAFTPSTAYSYSVRDHFSSPLTVDLDSAFAKGPFRAVSRLTAGLLPTSSGLYPTAGFVAAGRASESAGTPGQTLTFAVDQSTDPAPLFQPLASNFVEKAPLGFVAPTSGSSRASLHWTQAGTIVTWDAVAGATRNVTLPSLTSDSPFSPMGIVLRDVLPPLSGLLAIPSDPQSAGYALALANLDESLVLVPPSLVSKTDSAPTLGVGDLNVGPSPGTYNNFALAVADAASGLLALQLVSAPGGSTTPAPPTSLLGEREREREGGGVCVPKNDSTYETCEECSTDTTSLCGATLPCQATLKGSPDCCYAVDGINRCCSKRPPGYDGFDGDGCH